MDQRKGFHTVRDFITNPTMEASGILTIPDYVAARLRNEPVEGTTPVQVAEQLKGHAARARENVEHVRRDIEKPAKELRRTLGDILAMADLGNYYASKILGAVELALFEKTGDAKHKAAAVKHLEDAVRHWQDYAAVARTQYRPQLLARTRELDWLHLLEDVKQDVAIARSAKAK